MVRKRRRNRKYNRNLVKAWRFARRHSRFVSIVFVSVLVGVGLRSWLGMSVQVSSWSMLVTFCVGLAFIAYRDIGYGAVYVVLGHHPITGMICVLYVGLTTQKPWTDASGTRRWPRIEQHLYGSARYGKPAKSWSDTVTSWHFAHESWYFLPALLALLEVVNIRLRRPLYNDKLNGGNLDRIDKWTANRQRAERDQIMYAQEYWETLR